MISYKKFPEKKPFKKMPWEQRMFTTSHGKKGLDIENTPGYIQYADA